MCSYLKEYYKQVPRVNVSLVDIKVPNQKSHPYTTLECTLGG